MCSTSRSERVARLAGTASARAMLSDSIVAATPPPARSRNLRRLTADISITCHIHGQRPLRRPGLSNLGYPPGQGEPHILGLVRRWIGSPAREQLERLGGTPALLIIGG